MTEDDRRATVRRLCGWLALLSDTKRLATLEECCLFEKYGQQHYKPTPARLQEVSHLRPEIQKAIWKAKQAGMLTKVSAIVNKFVKQLLAVDWARQALLHTWLKLAEQFEEFHKEFRMKCGFPRWAKHADLSALKPA